ncbi:MAG: LamG domain-containing protein [Minisyncoccales bacterium]|jgi:prepilin-type N-terminal cleavage/methylation domain-containing protein
MFSALKTKEKQSAFTLVELLVVVAVLALLASIVFSNLTGAREQAKISNALSFQSNMHNLLGADLVGWWNFDEDTGNIAKDSSGYGNDGTLKNFNFNDSSGWSNDTPSPSGYSLKFDGSNDYVDVGDIYQYAETISFWIKPNVPITELSSSATPIDLGKRTSGYFSISFGSVTNLVESEIVTVMHTTSDSHRRSSYISSSDSLLADKWYHFVFTRVGGDLNWYIYLNGDRVDNFYYGKNSPATLADNVRIGSRNDNASYFNGLIDDVRIYSRALTAYEVQTLYAQTKDNYLAEEQ